MASRFARWRRRQDVSVLDGRPEGVPATLVFAFDGFLQAGSAARLAVEHISALDEGEVLHELELDDYYDYRARRPPMTFDRDRYDDYEAPSLELRLHHDDHGVPFLVLSGPEPDFRWEQFAEEVHDLLVEYGVELSVGLASVPMGVPHTRPTLLTAHGSRRELLDRKNPFRAQVVVPSSIQSLLEVRLGQWGHDVIGYVAHVPQYVAQVEYVPGAVALLEAVSQRPGLQLDLEELRVAQAEAVADIQEQVEQQDGESVLASLEEQYDQLVRPATGPSLPDEADLPTPDELGKQFEQFLAELDHEKGERGGE